MQVLITNKVETEDGIAFAATCGNKSAEIWISKRSTAIDVCCINASHKAWGGSGRVFWSREDALNGYKSAEMRAIVATALGA
jgi:hypothetical protein